MIIVVGGIKGGSGKTTVATNLAIMRAADGRDVLMIDADDQETAADFTQLRNEKLGNAGYTSIKLAGPADPDFPTCREVRRHHCGYRRSGYYKPASRVSNRRSVAGSFCAALI